MAENNNLLQALQTLVKTEQTKINTAVDAIIESYAAGFANVKPLPQQHFIDGSKIAYPVIPNVPVVWPRFANDTAGVKGPIQAGDKCLLIFCQQAIDGSDDLRRFSLIDAYCIIGAFGVTQDNSRATDNQSMQLYFGDAYLAITPEGKLLINAPAGIEITTPNTLHKGKMTVTESLCYQAGMQGTGTINVTSGDIKTDGTSLKQHIHREHDGPMTGNAQ